MDSPNQKWVTDVTEFSLFGQKLYLSAMESVFTGNIDERLDLLLVKLKV